MANPPESEPTEKRVRARELGIPLGRFKTGRHNAITDVEGVLVGHSTIIRGEGPLRPGHGPVRTGVTAILPNRGNIFMERLNGGGFVLNGAGEVAGMTQLMEWGLVETPMLLTNTMSVGAASDALARHMVEKYPGIGDEHDVIIPIVGECDDSYLNDISGRHVRAEHVFEAIRNASEGPVPEGNVGGGTGMVTCDFKGGIGTSSRKLPEALGGYTLGVLVMSNFGKMHNLRVGGLPVGEVLAEKFKDVPRRGFSYGSIIVVVATDAPAAEELLPGMPPRRMNAVTCLYFAAPEPPVRGPYLVLNGEGRGPVNNLAVMSEVAPSYAPEGQALVSVSVLETAEDSETPEARVREQLTEWFGGGVAKWKHLRTYAIPNALPAQPPESFEEPHRTVRLSSGLYVCGDYRENGSIEGAMVSGRRAAEALLRDRGLD